MPFIVYSTAESCQLAEIFSRYNSRYNFPVIDGNAVTRQIAFAFTNCYVTARVPSTQEMPGLPLQIVVGVKLRILRTKQTSTAAVGLRHVRSTLCPRPLVTSLINQSEATLLQSPALSSTCLSMSGFAVTGFRALTSGMLGYGKRVRAGIPSKSGRVAGK